MSGHTLPVAAVTGAPDWSLRQSASRERFRLPSAIEYVHTQTDRHVELMGGAAAAGALIVVGPEYFTGCEMFLTTPDHQFRLAEAPDGRAVRKLKALACDSGAVLIASMSMRHGSRVLQTGIVLIPGNEEPILQPKISCLPLGDPLDSGFRIGELCGVKTGVFVCSDLTDCLEDQIAMAKAGMQLIALPGCGFAGDNWRQFLVARSIDLACGVIYADNGRGAIVDRRGRFLAETDRGGDVLAADLDLPPKPPSRRLVSSIARPR